MKKPWLRWPAFVVISVIFFTVIIINNFEYPIQSTTSTTANYVRFNLFSKIRPTKSMKERGKMEEVNPYILMFNMIPYAGSELLSVLIKQLEGLNSFKHVRLKKKFDWRLNREDQVNTAN